VSAGSRFRRSRRLAAAARNRLRPHPLVKLVTRLITAQAAVAAAIGLSYSRRHVPSIIITLMLVVALLGLAAMTRSGTHAAWVSAIGLESAFIMFGVIRFISSRYLGGTLLGIIGMGVLLHPAVARAFSEVPAPAERPGEAPPALGDAGAGALGDGAAG
jgi:ribose/xylose/arabinose/galactoside ABC-type transport system permease subunit